jgi:hypothetical protein
MATWTPANASEFQDTLYACNLGDTIILTAAATYRVPGIATDQQAFVLPGKSGGSDTDADYITIRSFALASLPEDTRVTKASSVYMPKIVAIGGRGAFQLAPHSRYWKFQGLEITNDSTGTSPEHVQDLIASSDWAYNPITNADAGHFIFDRCYIHPQEDNLTPADENYNFRTVSHGVTLNVSHLTIKNCRLSGFFGAFAHEHTTVIDSEAIAYSFGPGPLIVENNYLDSWYASILTGGADTSSANTGTISVSPVPSTTVFAVNVLNGALPVAEQMIAVSNVGKEYSAGKVLSVSGSTVTLEAPLVWNGLMNDTPAGPDSMTSAPVPVAGAAVQWAGYYQDGITVVRNTFNIDTAFAQYWKTFNGSNPKGYIEFKNGINILFEGNIMQGWPANIGFGLQNQSGSAPWSAIRNVVLKNNVFKRYSYAFGPMALTGYSRLTERGGNVLIHNNLVYGNGATDDVNGNASAFFTIGGLGIDGPLTVTHNTVIDTSSGFSIQVPGGEGVDITGTGTYKDNIIYGKTYGHQCTPSDGHAAQCYTSLDSDKNIVVNPQSVNPGDINSYWWAGSIVVDGIEDVGFTSIGTDNYRLTPESVGYLAATDEKSIGVDFDELEEALGESIGTSIVICNWNNYQVCQ